MSSESTRPRLWPLLSSLVVLVLTCATVYYLLLPRVQIVLDSRGGGLVITSKPTVPYTPSAEIQEVAAQVGFTPEAEELFWATEPQFGDDCQSTHARGCFIFIRSELFDDLKGRIVISSSVPTNAVGTAAHELLHAAWHQLSAAERETLGNQIDRLLDSGHPEAVGIRDQLLAVYGDQASQDLIHNELHSFLATLAFDLSPQWETYYGWYFTDRQAIVDSEIAWQYPPNGNNS